MLDVVEDEAHVTIAAVELGGAALHDLLEADHVLEEAPRDVDGGDRLQDDERRVHRDDPNGRVVVEDRPRDEEPEHQVVQRDGDRGSDDDEGVREHRQHRDEREEVEVHLDLHRSLTEVDQEPAEEHRGDAVCDRHMPRIVERLVRDRRPCKREERERERERRVRSVEPRDRDEDRHVQREESERDAVDPAEVAPFERRDDRR
ncbi:MAG: hypothetical protein QM702_21185 [Rubrivivax sp.]